MTLFSHSLIICCCRCEVAPVVSDSVRPHRRQPTRLPRPWGSPGKNTGVGCHFLLQCMRVKSESEVAQSCPTLRDPMDRAWDFPGKSPGAGCHRLLWALLLISCLFYKIIFFFIIKRVTELPINIMITSYGVSRLSKLFQTRSIKIYFVDQCMLFW